MRYIGLVGCVVVVICCATGSVAIADEKACPGNPDAIGTSRTITVDPAALPRIGSMYYRDSLPLNDHEVVITLDDGPIPPSTTLCRGVKLTEDLGSAAARLQAHSRARHLSSRPAPEASAPGKSVRRA